MSFSIHPILVNDGVVAKELHQVGLVAGGDAVTWGHPQHVHNFKDGGLSRIVSSSGSLLG